jgi:hypothetical protein
MAGPTVQEIVDSFTAKVTEHLDQSKLDGPVRLDPTRSIVVIPVKGKGQIHAYTDHKINDEGVQNVIHQISVVPSLKGLLKEG